jgi:hypothetical protein
MYACVNVFIFIYKIAGYELQQSYTTAAPIVLVDSLNSNLVLFGFDGLELSLSSWRLSSSGTTEGISVFITHTPTAF